MDLVFVGGTGQWILWELCKQALRSGRRPALNELFIIDADTAKSSRPDQETLTSLLETYLKPALGKSYANSVIRPNIPPDRSTIGEYIQHNEGLIDTALSFEERKPNVSLGFYARPRLAATWVSVAGFTAHDPLPFLRPEAIARQTPLVLVGSIVGGTGAGLLPMMMYQTRQGSPVVDWRRKVITIAVLPWFNPELSGGGPTGDAHKKVTWKECRQNAAGGIQALQRFLSHIDSKVQRAITQGHVQAANVPMTACYLVGAPHLLAKELPPPEPGSTLETPMVHPLTYAVADALEILAGSEPTQQLQNQHTAIGTLAVPKASKAINVSHFVGGNQHWEQAVPQSAATLWRAHNRERVEQIKKNANVSAMLEQLSKEDYDHAIGGWRERLGHFGKTMETLLRQARSSKNDVGIGIFCRSLKLSFSHKAKELQPNSSSNDGSLRGSSAQFDWARIQEKIDMHADNNTRNILEDAADCTSKVFKEEEINRRTDTIVNLLAEALMRWQFQEFPPTPIPSPPPEGSMTLIEHLKSDTQNIDLSRSNNGDGIGLRTLKSSELDLLAQSYQPPSPDLCISRSIASTLSLAHALAALVPRTGGATLKEGSPLLRVIQLWRAALHGLIVLKPIAKAEEHAEWYAKTENLEADFDPELRGIYAASDKTTLTLLGFLSADIGFVPSADLVEADDGLLPQESTKKQENSTLQKAFDSLVKKLPGDTDEDYKILAAFAQCHFPNNTDLATQPAWCRLLKGLVKTFVENPTDFLQANVFFSLTIPLRQAGSESRPEGVPRRANLALIVALQRVKEHKDNATFMLSSQNQPDKKILVCFHPFGAQGRAYECLWLRGEDITAFHEENVKRAALALPVA